jgi:DNA-binding MarR family transcriptional regulator
MSNGAGCLSGPGDYRDGTAYLLGVAGATARRQWTQALGKLDVTPSQFKVIMALAETGPRSQRELAEIVGIDPRNCVAVIDSLAARGLLSREIDPADRRRRTLALTNSGRSLTRKLATINTNIENQLLAPLEPKQRAALRHALTLILSQARKPNASR